MRIGIDARLWNETGVGRYIRALVTNLIQLDSPHTFVLFLLPSVFDSVSIPNSWEKVRVDARWHSLKEQLLLPIIFRNAKLDLVHIPYFSVPLISNLPFVVTIHDLTISQMPTGKATTLPPPLYFLKHMGYRLVMQKSILTAKKIITVSNSVKKDLIIKYRIDENKVRVIYESGEIEQITKSKKVTTPKKYLLYVGNAHPHKNLEKLIEAFTLIRKNSPDLDLVLIGRKDFFYNRLQSQYKYLLDNGIHFQNEVDNSQLAIWYKNAVALVFPSMSEGFGIPGLEAMNFGTPVFASDISVFREIYKDGASYFDQTSSHSMAEVIQKVLSDKVILKKLQINSKKIAGLYSWQKMAKETLEVYENCLGL